MIFRETGEILDVGLTFFEIGGVEWAELVGILEHLVLAPTVHDAAEELETDDGVDDDDEYD